jgi:hypothetical protein
MASSLTLQANAGRCGGVPAVTYHDRSPGRREGPYSYAFFRFEPCPLDVFDRQGDVFSIGPNALRVPLDIVMAGVVDHIHDHHAAASAIQSGRGATVRGPAPSGQASNSALRRANL